MNGTLIEMEEIQLYQFSIARIFLSALKDLGNCIGREIFLSILKGRKDSKIIKSKYYLSKYYGIFSVFRGNELSKILDDLMERGFIGKVEKGNITFLFTVKDESLLEGETLSFISYISDSEIHLIPEEKQALYEDLRAVRYAISKRINRPVFSICSDALLREICLFEPMKKEDFLYIAGLGDYFVENYGDEFLAVMNQ